MSPEAWDAFLRVTFAFLEDAVPLVGAGMWLGWCARGRADRRRLAERRKPEVS